MKLCLTCRQLSSDRDLSGEALFCPHCGRSFGVRRCRSCKKKPSSPLDATHCVHCGGTTLTDATSYLNLGWLVWLLSAGLVFVLLRWSGPVLASVFGMRLGSGWQSVRAWLMGLLDHVLFWIFFCGMFSVFVSMILSFLPREMANPWQKMLNVLFHLVVKGGTKAMQLGWRGVIWLFQRLTNSQRRL